MVHNCDFNHKNIYVILSLMVKKRTKIHLSLIMGVDNNNINKIVTLFSPVGSLGLRQVCSPVQLVLDNGTVTLNVRHKVLDAHISYFILTLSYQCLYIYIYIYK
jgi:hypothetical protein